MGTPDDKLGLTAEEYDPGVTISQDSEQGEYKNGSVLPFDYVNNYGTRNSWKPVRSNTFLASVRAVFDDRVDSVTIMR